MKGSIIIVTTTNIISTIMFLLLGISFILYKRDFLLNKDVSVTTKIIKYINKNT